MRNVNREVLNKVYAYFEKHPNVSAEEGNDKEGNEKEGNEKSKPTEEALAKWNEDYLKDVKQPELFELILVRPYFFP